MALTKEWKDGEAGGTELDAAALKDLEARTQAAIAEGVEADLPASVVSGSPTGGVPAWVKETTYALNTLVTEGGSTYINKEAHKSAATWAADEAKWQAVGTAGLTKAEVEALITALEAEIAPVNTEGTLGADSDTQVASQKATKTYVDTQPQMQMPQLVVPDILGRAPIAAATGAMTEKRLTLLRATIPKAGTLHDLIAYVGTKSGKFILTVYDTGEAKAGYYTLLAHKELEPSEATRWQSAGDPALEGMSRGQQIMLGIVANNATLTIGRGGGGAIAASSGQLPTSFLAAGGGNLPKLAGYLTLGAFEAPAEIAEASLESVGGAAPIPYALLARIA